MSLRVSSVVLVLCYLGAAVGANLLIAALGPDWLPLTALVVVPFDLASRDLLHERWHGRQLWPRMTAMIVAASLLTVLVNRQAHAVAIASFASFLCSGLTDAVAYQLTEGRSRRVRMNASNVASAVVDSVTFPLIAFVGAVSPGLVLAQALTKVVGGAAWTHVLLRLGLGDPEPGESRLAGRFRRQFQPSEEWLAAREAERQKVLARLGVPVYLPDGFEGEVRRDHGITPL